MCVLFLLYLRRLWNEAGKVPLNKNEFDALVSLAFYIGAGAFKGSTLLTKLKTGDRTGAADQFLVWNKITLNGKKQVLRGLRTRRKAERKQFLSTEKPEIVVPVSIVKTAPVTKSKRFWTWLTAAALPARLIRLAGTTGIRGDYWRYCALNGLPPPHTQEINKGGGHRAS